MSTKVNNTLHKSSLTSESSIGKNHVQIERLDTLDSPNNNNVSSPNSSLKNERVASDLLKMLDHDSILDGLEDLPPSDHLLDDDPEVGLYEGEHVNGFHPGKVTNSMESASGDGSFFHSHSDLSDDDHDSPLHFHNERQFELEFRLHESEQKVEQLTLQLKGKSMQLEQVQVALISYEEEIMQLRQQMAHGSDVSDEEQASKKPTPSAATPPPLGAVSLETAEQLSSKIIKLQQRVEELEDIMVYTKLDNAQLRETTDFLKSKLKQYTKKATDKKSPTRAGNARGYFGRT